MLSTMDFSRKFVAAGKSTERFAGRFGSLTWRYRAEALAMIIVVGCQNGLRTWCFKNYWIGLSTWAGAGGEGVSRPTW